MLMNPNCHPQAICYPSKPIKMLITDQCDERCNSTNINMHVFAFGQLAPVKEGRMGVRYRVVGGACKGASHPLLSLPTQWAPCGGCRTHGHGP